MDDMKLTIAIIASLTTLFLAYINYRLNRRIDKKSKKTDMRAQSYIDFVNSVSRLAQISKGNMTNRREILMRLADAKTRIAIYGDRSVIKALASFDKNFQKLESKESHDAFMKIIYEMRADAVGRRSEEPLEDLKQIIFGTKRKQ